MKKFFGLLIITVMLSVACGDDNADCTAQQFNTDVNLAIDKANAAGQIWANDPTAANCDDFKDAANDVLDVVEDFDGCAGISQSDYDQTLDDARAFFNSLAC